ncbi:MAG: hypothetical protein J5J06_07540 [Phycisphaerae bacterium]|nr:hypothetical protein [Phycisphaerae bacterium]
MTSRTDVGLSANDPSKLIDAFDRRILAALHEFEFDPYVGKGAREKRISPVAAYLIYAATVSLIKVGDNRLSWPIAEFDVHARLAALDSLGFVQKRNSHWPVLGCRSMRDGRFICMDTENGTTPYLVGDRPNQTVKDCRYREYRVSFGLYSELDEALRDARYYEPDADHSTIFTEVVETFPRLTWLYYDPAAEKELADDLGLDSLEESPWGRCYTLTPAGIAVVRSSKSRESEAAKEAPPQKAHAPQADDRYEWARQAELIRATEQVLGQPVFHKGGFSRLCGKQIETNGKAGHLKRVRISSFLTWIQKREDLGNEEVAQIRNAIIGEITSRKS